MDKLSHGHTNIMDILMTGHKKWVPTVTGHNVLYGEVMPTHRWG